MNLPTILQQLAEMQYTEAQANKQTIKDAGDKLVKLIQDFLKPKEEKVEDLF